MCQINKIKTANLLYVDYKTDEDILNLVLSESQKDKLSKLRFLISELRKDSRMPITHICKKFNIAHSTAFDYLKIIKKFYDFTLVKKNGNCKEVKKYKQNGVNKNLSKGGEKWH